MKISYRLFSNAIALLVLILAIIQGWRTLNRPSDGTFWKPIPSQLYITRNIPVLDEDGVSVSISDSILVGDLLIMLNGQTPNVQSDVDRIMETLSNSNSFTIQIFRPTNSDRLTFKTAMRHIPDQFVSQISSGFYLDKVFNNGPAERAGMKQGDIVIGINDNKLHGISVSDPVFYLQLTMNPRNEFVLEAERQLRDATVGYIMKFNVIRQNQFMTFTVQLERFAFTYKLLWLFILLPLWFVVVGAYYTIYMPTKELIFLLCLPFGYLSLVLLSRELNYSAWAITLDLGIPLSLWVVYIARKNRFTKRFNIF